MSSGGHRLHELLADAAAGRFPAVDGLVEVVAPHPQFPGVHAVVAFTGHAIVMTDRPRDWVLGLRVDGFGAVHHPDVLRALAGPTGWIGVLDGLLVRRGTGPGTGNGVSSESGTNSLQRSTDLARHPRVAHALAIRWGVEVWSGKCGLVTLGFGPGGRRELSYETWPQLQGTVVGNELLTQALRLVPEGEAVFAACSPGNARSLRALLRAGFAPIASEVVLLPGKPSPQPRVDGRKMPWRHAASEESGTSPQS